MQGFKIGGQPISPASIVAFEGGYRIELQTYLVVALTLVMMALCGSTFRIVLGISVLALILVEGHAYLKDRLTVRVRLRDHRTLLLSCLSERDVQLTLARVRSIAPAVEVKSIAPERAAG
ncbi:hypothetical protein GCM10007036_41320 [Alsobacter metallidurans]|uniref:Uncharacterized protein n=1 Tax=Alsobacter metallidurans TaxID=340221 RepID=A0A917MLK9_9HYPH|nr:hypothetical protein [Alsobacter metallidurans]GGH30613.1 hypothetical protein GCM10007036_41320 [Alsobacter metallidurans]